MSTNYYIRVHIGKRSSQGASKPMLFTWAIDPSLLAKLPRHSRISNEYGEFFALSPSGWNEHVSDLDHDYDSIGKDFS